MPVSDRLRRFGALLRDRPGRALRFASAFVRGLWYAAYFRVSRPDVRIGLPFFAFARVSIEGPGRVRIGPRCFVMASVFRGLSIVTLSPEAEVEIGARCALGGLTLRCRERVTLGDGVMTAASLVQDVLFSDLAAAARSGAHATEAASVMLGANVWLGLSSTVLCGTQLGDDDVVASGALCLRTSADPYAFVSGSPAGRSLPISRMLALKAHA